MTTKTIKINDKDYTFSPLNFKFLKQNMQKITKILELEVIDQLEFTSLAVFASLKKHHTEITIDVVEEEILNFANFQELLNVVLEVSGFIKSSDSTSSQDEEKKN